MLNYCFPAQVFVLAAVLTAQQQPPPAPPEISLKLRTVEGRQEFRLGEKIALEYEYTASKGTFFLADDYRNLQDGAAFAISCEPGVPSQAEGQKQVFRVLNLFNQMLLDPKCMRSGIGGHSGSGFSRHGDMQLSANPIRYEINLNQALRIGEPGTYVCSARSAQVTDMPQSVSPRRALLLQSAPIRIRILSAPAWAMKESRELASQFEQRCKKDEFFGKGQLECFDISHRLTYLDTPEAVAAMIRLSKGEHEKWGTGFPEAIRSTRHRRIALKALTQRIQDPDYTVTPNTLEMLGAWGLESEVPHAFDNDHNPGEHHTLALHQLRKYTRLLGESLASKDAVAAEQSFQTYFANAQKRDCDGVPLIAREEMDAVGNAARAALKARATR